MAGGIRFSFGSQSAGFLGARVGPYLLEKSGRRTPLIEVVRKLSTEIAPQSDRSAAAAPREDYLSMRTNMENVYNLVDKSSAVKLDISFAPGESIDFLSSSGKGHELDLRYCLGMVVLPCLRENGEWSQGFEITMAQPRAGELKEFIGSAPGLKSTLKDIIFIHPYDENGKALDQDRFNWAMGWLLGRIKVRHLLLERGLPANALSQNAKNVYAYLYLADIYYGQLQAAGPEKERIEAKISRIVEQITQPVRLMTEKELALLRDMIN